MTKRFSSLTLGLAVVFSLLVGAGLTSVISSDDIYDQLGKIKDVLLLTGRYYVEDVDTQKLTESAISGILSQLDPHSAYIPATQMQRVTEDFQGSFEGIGIEYQVLNDTLLVVAPIVGGPSEALGILPGDKIVKINDTTAIGITQLGVQKKLRGPKGTRVHVSILRTGSKDLLEFDITRDKIPIYTVDTEHMVAPSIGYISVTRFAATTHQEFLDAATKLKSQGMRRLILDLRQNAGGYLEQAYRMVDEFIPGGKKVVYTKGRLQEFNEEYVATDGGKLEDVSVIVLVNHGSASASEIVAGAIQDWDRGLIVGETTFGKGLVQRQFDLKDGSAFRLTTARYYTPSGRLIQRPYNGDKTLYAHEALNREEEEGDNITHKVEKDSLRPMFKTMGGRKVYGDGGITPDYIVKSDRLSEFTVQLRARLVLLEYASRYLEKEGSRLKSTYGTDSERFATSFAVSEKMRHEVVQLAKGKGIDFKEDQYKQDLRFIDAYVKSTIAKNLWGNEGSSRVMLKEDGQFKKALQMFPEAERIAGML